MGSAARTVNLPLHGGKTYTPLCRHAQHFFSHSAAFTKYISKCRLFPYGLRNRARFLSRQRTAIPPWHLTVGRLFCWESPYCLRQYGLWSPCFAFAQYGLLVALFRFRSIRAPSTAMCSGRGPCAHTPPPPTDLSLVWFTVQTQENRSDYQRTKGKNTGNLPSMDLWLQEDCSRTWTYKRPSSAGSRYNS